MPASHDDFLRLYLAAQDDLRAYLAAAVRDWSRADDLMQDTALALWHAFERYDPQRPFGAWARGVAMHMLYKEWDRVRRGPRAVDPATAILLLDAFARTDEPHEDRRLDALRRCLETVDARTRELLAQRYADDLGPEAIAARTGNGLEAVKKALTRAKSRLAACVDRRLATGAA